MLTVVLFQASSPSERRNLTYNEFVQLVRREANNPDGNSGAPQEEINKNGESTTQIGFRDLRQLMFEQYKGHEAMIVKPSAVIINLSPLRALIFREKLILVIRKKTEDLTNELESELTTQQQNLTEVSFFHIALHALIATAELQFERTVSKAKNDLNAQHIVSTTFAKKRLLLQKAQVQFEMFLESSRRKHALFGRTLENDEKMTLLTQLLGEKDSPTAAVGEASEIIEALLESGEQFYHREKRDIELLVENIKSDQAGCSFEHQLQETRLFLLNSGAILVMATATFGLFFAQVFSQMLSPPDNLAAGGTFPNSYPLNDSTSTFPAFLGITLTLASIIVCGVIVGLIIFCKYAAAAVEQE